MYLILTFRLCLCSNWVRCSLFVWTQTILFVSFYLIATVLIETWKWSKIKLNGDCNEYLHELRVNIFSFPFYSTSNDEENQPSNPNNANQTAVMDKTVQQMTQGFVTLFEKELDQVQYSLKEALLVTHSMKKKPNLIVAIAKLIMAYFQNETRKNGCWIGALECRSYSGKPWKLPGIGMNERNACISTICQLKLFGLCFFFQFYMVKELTDKLHLIKKRMLNMHQRVKHLKVDFFAGLFFCIT